MSLSAMTWAVQAPISRPTAKLALVCLADYASEEGLCYPSQKSLAERVGVTERALRDALQWLETEGYVVRAERRRTDGSRTSDAYQLPEDAYRKNFPHPRKKTQSSPEDISGLTTFDPASEPSSLRSERKRELSQFDELVLVLDADHANAVIAHRKNLKAKFTPYAAKLLAAKFAKCADPNAAADAMIVNGWQGFEPGWLERQQTRGSPPPRQPSLADAFAAVSLEAENRNDPRYRTSDQGPRSAIPHLSRVSGG